MKTDEELKAEFIAKHGVKTLRPGKANAKRCKVQYRPDLDRLPINPNFTKTEREKDLAIRAKQAKQSARYLTAENKRLRAVERRDQLRIAKFKAKRKRPTPQVRELNAIAEKIKTIASAKLDGSDVPRD